MKNLKHALSTLLVTLIAFATHAQLAKSGWPTGLMKNVIVLPNGDLKITPSKTSSSHDFDYLAGKWTMRNKKLKVRLRNSHEWTEFESTDENHNILNGVGNTDIFKTTGADGKPYEGLTVRLFNPKTRLWSLYWAASDKGTMDPPVVGSFEGSIGKFYGRDIYEGKPILFVFVWDKTDMDNPVWSQAFSTDNGKTWEWNFTNISHRVK